MGNRNKRSKGISLLALVITITIMLILAGILIFQAQKYNQTKELNELYSDIKVLKDSVGVYYLQYNTLPLGEKVDVDVKAIVGDQINVNDGDDYYYIDISALENLTLSDKRNPAGYIINTTTHEIYYIDGVTVDDKIYYKDTTTSSEIITDEEDTLKVTISSDAEKITNKTTIIYTIEFNKKVVDFDKDDVSVTNGNKLELIQISDTKYTIEVDRVEDGVQIVQVRKGVCTDEEGNENAASNVSRITIDTIAPTITATPNTSEELETVDVTIIVEDVGTGLSNNTEYKYIVSASNTEVPNEVWNNYTNGKEITIGDGLKGTYYLWIKGVEDKAGNTSAGTVEGYTVIGPYDFTNLRSSVVIKPNGGIYNGKKEETVLEGEVGETIIVNDPVREHTLTFNTHGGTEVPDQKVSYEFDKWVHTGSGSLNNDVYTYGEDSGIITADWIITDITLPTTSKEGYTFDGWYTQSIAGTKITNQTEITEDMTLHAHWIINSYNLTIDPNGGTWNNSSNKTTITKEYNTQQEIDNPERSYTVKFETFGGTGHADIVADWKFQNWELTGSGKLTGSNYTFGAGDGTLKALWESATYADIEMPEPEKQGYTFIGWCTSQENGNGSGNIVTPNEVIDKDITLYAKWEKNTNTAYKVEHYIQNLDESYTLKETENLQGTTDEIATAEAKTYTGFTLDMQADGTVSSGTIATDGSLVLKLYYSRNKHNINVEKVPGAEIVVEGEGKFEEEISIEIGTEPGYEFNGWEIVDEDGNTIPVEDTNKETFTMPDSDVIVKADVTPISYTISYNLNGGTVTPANPTNYTVESETFTLNQPTKLGYIFIGWTGSNGTTPELYVSITKGTTGNLNYTANWEVSDSTAYKVEHYTENLDGTYTLREIETLYRKHR